MKMLAVCGMLRHLMTLMRLISVRGVLHRDLFSAQSVGKSNVERAMRHTAETWLHSQFNALLRTKLEARARWMTCHFTN